MTVINSYYVAVLMCVITMLCWGSWANTQKLASKEWKFQLFYWDYGFGVLLWALVLAFTFGSIGEAGRSFLTDLSQLNAKGNIGFLFRSNVLWAFIGGVVFNFSNLLLVIAIDIAGLAVAFPIGVGLALVLGVVSTYYFRPEGDPMLLGAGVALVLVAIILNAIAYKKLQGTKKSGNTSALGITISVIAGVLMGCGFFALVAKGMAKNFHQPEPGMMTPYTALVVFSFGLVLSNFLWNTLVMLKPVQGEPVPFKDYFTRGSFKLHCIGILGGIIWNIGMSFSLIASGQAGAALSYGLGQGATMVAALWGVFIWREFKGAPKGTNSLLVAMFFFFVAGLSLLIYSKM